MFLKLEQSLIPSRLSSRLTFFYSSTFLLLIIITLLGLYFSLGRLMNSRIDNDLLEDVEEFQQFFQQGGLKQVKSEIQRETFQLEDHSKELFRLYSGEGDLLFSSPGKQWSEFSLDASMIQAINSDNEPLIWTLQLQDLEHPLRLIHTRLDDNLILQIGESTAIKQEVMSMVLQSFVIVLLIATPLTSFIGWWIAQKSARSIETISQSVAELEQGKLDTRVNIDTSVDEIQRLANAFNRMAGRIESLITEMREMIDNIAHDLRSPLGRIKAISEQALISAQKPSEYINAAEQTLGETERLLRMINTTLDIAEIEAGVYAETNEEIDIANIVEEACELFEPVAQKNQLTLQSSIKGHCKMYGNLQNLQRMVANLIDNAIKYTPVGGLIKVKLDQDDVYCRIRVSDTGIGISTENQLRIFERFYRCDNSRSSEGCGLGLSFSKAVARQHGGDIQIASEPNHLTTFTVLLPA